MKRLRHPIRAIREPFGTAGLILAGIALIAALGGTALAAGGLTKSQEKQVTKIAKKYAGKNGKNGINGINGTNGAPGEKGATGAAGTNGSNGKDGISAKTKTFVGVKGSCTEGGIEVESATPTVNVCNGKKGEKGEPGEPGVIHPEETLASGASETGAWGGSAYNVAEFGQAMFPISFTIPLEEPGKAVFLDKKITKEGTVEEKEGCTGTLSEPTAPAGTLCIYTAEEERVGFGEGFVVFNTLFAKYDRTGSIVRFSHQEGISELVADGSWAVTAP